MSYVGDMQSYLQQSQNWAAEQRASQQRMQALDQARLKGITQAKADDTTVRELMKVRTQSVWAGLQVLTIVCFVILMLLYNSVFAKDKRMFWVLTVFMMGMLIWKFVQIVREDGGLAVGHLS